MIQILYMNCDIKEKERVSIYKVSVLIFVELVEPKIISQRTLNVQRSLFLIKFRVSLQEF